MSQTYNTKATWGRERTEQLEAFLNNISYLMAGGLRMFLKTGGLIASNLIDIGFGSVVWGIVIHDYQNQLPVWFTFSVGFLISLVMTRAQIYFNEQIFQGGFKFTVRDVIFSGINILLTLFDTILDVSILAYLIFDRSPLDLFEILRYESVPGMFYVFAMIVVFLSTFGDAVNLMFFTEQNQKEKYGNTRQSTNTQLPQNSVPRRSNNYRPNTGSSQVTRLPSGSRERGVPGRSRPLPGDLDS